MMEPDKITELAVGLYKAQLIRGTYLVYEADQYLEMFVKYIIKTNKLAKELLIKELNNEDS